MLPEEWELGPARPWRAMYWLYWMVDWLRILLLMFMVLSGGVEKKMLAGYRGRSEVWVVVKMPGN